MCIHYMQLKPLKYMPTLHKPHDYICEYNSELFHKTAGNKLVEVKKVLIDTNYRNSAIKRVPFSLSSPRISCTFGFCSSKSRLREPVSGKDFRMSATISTQGSESTVASWMISDRASFIWQETKVALVKPL